MGRTEILCAVCHSWWPDITPPGRSAPPPLAEQHCRCGRCSDQSDSAYLPISASTGQRLELYRYPPISQHYLRLHDPIGLPDEAATEGNAGSGSLNFIVGGRFYGTRGSAIRVSNGHMDCSRVTGYPEVILSGWARSLCTSLPVLRNRRCGKLGFLPILPAPSCKRVASSG